MRGFRSLPPDPDQQVWGKLTLAALLALILCGVMGYAGLRASDVAVGDAAKLVADRTLADHAALLATALLGLPFFGLPALLLVVPAAGLLVWRGWAGALSYVALGWALGLPLVHWIFNGDLTSEAPDLLPHILVALTFAALLTKAILTFGPLRLRPALSMA